MKLFIALIFSILAIAGYSQYRNIDSLKLILQRETTDTGQISKTILLGSFYQNIRNDSALIYFRDALNRSLKIGYKTGEISARHHIAFFLFDIKSDYTTALDLYLETIQLIENATDTSFAFRNRKFFVTRDISFIYERIKDYDKQLEYTLKLKSLISEGIYKDSANIQSANGILFNRLGGAYLNLNRFDSARYYFLKGLNWGIEKNDLTHISLAAAGLGTINSKQNHVDSAVYYFHIAIPAALAINRNNIYNRINISLAELYWQNKQTDSAFYYAKTAFSLAKQQTALSQVIEAAALLADIYYAEKQTDSAYKYLNQSMQLKDSLFGADKIAVMQNLSLKKSLQDQREEQAKAQAVKDYQSKIKMYSLAAGLVVLLIISLLLYRNSRQRQNAHKKITKAYEELKSTQAQLIQSEKMASLGELTAGIAHEIQNPLNFVNNFSEVNNELIDELKQEAEKGNIDEVKIIADDIKENSEKINQHGKRADAIVKNMLQHSRQTKGIKEPTDINALCDEYLRLSYYGFRAKDKSFNAEFKTDFDESLSADEAGIGKINIVPQDMGRVLLNLYNNAFYATSQKQKAESSKPDPESSQYVPTVTVVTKKLNDKIELIVKDNGNGIPQNIVDKIFQPFFTTKPTGQGTGLGLSLAYDIIKAHGGEIKVETKEARPDDPVGRGEGAEFLIELPLK